MCRFRTHHPHLLMGLLLAVLPLCALHAQTQRSMELTVGPSTAFDRTGTSIGLQFLPVSRRLSASTTIRFGAAVTRLRTGMQSYSSVDRTILALAPLAQFEIRPFLAGPDVFVQGSIPYIRSSVPDFVSTQNPASIPPEDRRGTTGGVGIGAGIGLKQTIGSRLFVTAGYSAIRQSLFEGAGKSITRLAGGVGVAF